MRCETEWPIPAPEVIHAAITTPLRGLWIDHVPTGAQFAAMGLLCIDDAEEALRSPLGYLRPHRAPEAHHPCPRHRVGVGDGSAPRNPLVSATIRVSTAVPASIRLPPRTANAASGPWKMIAPSA